MNNLFGPIIGAILGGMIGFVLGYFLFILKERRAICKLEYEKVSSLSLISMAETIRNRIKVSCDGKPTDNIFSFKFRIRNTGKVTIEEIPIHVEFDDKDTEILYIQGTFEVKGKRRRIKPFLEKTDKYKEKFIILPGLDPGERATFDVFTKDNKTAQLASLKIELGEEKSLGTKFPEKREITPIWYIVPSAALTAIVATIAVGAWALLVQKTTGGGLGWSLIGILGAIAVILVVLIVFEKPLR